MMTIITACLLKLLPRFLSFLLLDSRWVLLVLQDGAVFFLFRYASIITSEHTGFFYPTVVFVYFV